MSATNNNMAIAQEFGHSALPENTVITPSETSQSRVIKIKAVNGETGEFVEKLLTLATGTSRNYLLGRHPSCDLVLNSAEVSSIHGRIWYQDGQSFYADLGSTNGSQIDNRVVAVNQVFPLEEHSLLCIGGFVLSIADCSPVNQVIVAPSQIPHWSSGELTVRCIGVIAETHDVKTFRFIAQPKVLFDYQPGQFVNLDLEIDGNKVMRSYSISSTPSRPQILEITVKRVSAPSNVPNAPPGLVSNWLHDNVRVGSQVKLIGPMGKFTCVDRPAQKLLFISAGSGITPMMSMSRWLCDRGADVDIVFIHSVRTIGDVIFRHELESMAARYENFKLAVTTTRQEPGQAWYGCTGRLNELMLQAIAPDFKERLVYVCGPNPFMEGIKTMLKTLGFPIENYHQESFGNSQRKLPTKPKETDEYGEEDSKPKFSPISEKRENLTSVKTTSVKATSARSPIVVFAKEGKEITGDPEETILELAEQKGIQLPSGCRMGACGACKLPLLEGEVSYDDEPSCESGHLLTCIAKPVGRVVVEA